MHSGEILAQRYKILRVVGIRGIKKRYVGEDITTKERVIVETLHESFRNNRQSIDEFQYEVRLSKRLNNPYFKAYIETLTQDGISYNIWKYNDAQPLSRNPSLSTLTSRDACRFISFCVRALSLAHESGVIHGALSTDVILITPQLEPVIIGFSAPGVTPITDPGIEDGLSAYAACAPELFQGEPIDESCDFYALGKIAQFLFSRIDDNSDSNLNFQNQKNIEPVEITRARSVILDLNSAVRQYRLETARRIADTSFLDDMSTPPGGTQVIKISAKQSRKLKKANKTPKAQRSEQSKFVIAISLKAIAIVTIAVSAIVIVAKLTEQN